MIKRMFTFIAVLLVGLLLSFATGLILGLIATYGNNLASGFDGMPSFGFMTAFIISILSAIISQFINSNRIKNTLGIVSGILTGLIIILGAFFWRTYAPEGILILAAILLIPGLIITFVLAWLTETILNFNKAPGLEAGEPAIIQP